MARLAMVDGMVLSKRELPDVEFADANGPPWRKGALYYLYVGRDSDDERPTVFVTEDRELWDAFKEGSSCRVVLEQ